MLKVELTVWPPSDQNFLEAKNVCQCHQYLEKN